MGHAFFCICNSKTKIQTVNILPMHFSNFFQETLTPIDPVQHVVLHQYKQKSIFNHV